MNQSSKPQRSNIAITIIQTIAGIAAVAMIAYFMGGFEYAKQYLTPEKPEITNEAVRAPNVRRSRTFPGPPISVDQIFSKAQANCGVIVGEVTESSVIIQTRLTTGEILGQGDTEGLEGFVRFILEPVVKRSTSDFRQLRALRRAAEEDKQTREIRTSAEHDHIARACFEGLEANTTYECVAWIGENDEQLRRGPVIRFHTLPGAEIQTQQSIAVVTGMNYAKYYGDKPMDDEDPDESSEETVAEEPNRSLGYPALESMAFLTPDFFVGTGDNVYYDQPKKPRAKTIDAMRRKWHQQFFQIRFHQLFERTPTYWQVDDHDYRVNDCDNTGDYEPTPELAQQVLFEQLPMLYIPRENAVAGETEIASAGEASNKTYRTHRITKDLQIWLTDNRLYRSPNKMEDGPEKTIWGSEQKEWLKKTLAASDATFKVLISPTPMIGPDDAYKKDNHTNVGGFQNERDEFFQWLDESGLNRGNFFIVCGDRHWQYHSIHPMGFEEFSSGALVDANSRLGRKPGDPKSTDPEGLIQQPYTQSPASGGFLIFTVNPGGFDQDAQLTFKFYDEQGKDLYQVHRRVSSADD